MADERPARPLEASLCAGRGALPSSCLLSTWAKGQWALEPGCLTHADGSAPGTRVFAVGCEALGLGCAICGPELKSGSDPTC